MRWDEMRKSNEVEDRRGESASSGFGLGGILGFGSFKLRLGIIAVAVVVSLLMGKNPLTVLSYLMNGHSAAPVSHSSPAVATTPPAEDKTAQMVRAVLGDTEDVWGKIFANAKQEYVHPKLVLFRQRVDSACGQASAAVGPFYCGGDQKVFIDLSFFEELQQRFGAPGDFAQAYVIAHEVGHHVQHLLGISERIREKQANLSERGKNALSVRLELQADCLAGIWGHSANQRGLLEVGDLDEALRAANAIGDDRLQKEATGEVVPDAFTHGTSEQRIHWFKVGFESGDFARCNTFKAASLN